jgi:gp27
LYKNIKAIDIEWEILYHNLYYVKGSVRNMEKILNVAEYIFKEYQRVTGEYIDEMKLQKLLYFSQRESLAILNKPMFSEKFEGWKYGPVSREVRIYFTQEDGIQTYTEDIKSENKYIVNNVILEYGSLASWKLSEMTHKEISWLNSRKGLSENENGNKKIELEDIREDAKKVRPYDYIWDMYYDEFEDVIQ